MTTIRKSRITIDAEWNEKYQTECFEQICITKFVEQIC